MTYPNGRVLSYTYAAGLDADLGRLTSLSDSTGTLESLVYLGAGTVVARNHPLNNLNLTLGLDDFGRVNDQRWSRNGVDRDRFAYGYDRSGNRLYKENLVNGAFSELYAYDTLNRLSSMDRGTLNAAKDAIVGTPQPKPGLVAGCFGQQPVHPGRLLPRRPCTR